LTQRNYLANKADFSTNKVLRGRGELEENKNRNMKSSQSKNATDIGCQPSQVPVQPLQDK
jgi:hypothetical protein